MPRLRQVKEFVPVRTPDRALKEEGQDQLDQGEEIEKMLGFHGKKVKTSDYIHEKF
jgi:hypothetical protein